MDEILLSLLKYVAGKLESAAASKVEAYFSTPDPTQAIINAMASSQQNDYINLEKAINSILTDSYLIKLYDTWTTYSNAVNGQLNQQNISDFESFLDVTNEDTGFAAAASSLYLAMFGTSISVQFSYTGGNNANNNTQQLTGNAYVATTGQTLMGTGQTNLLSWGDQMLQLIPQITGYLATLTNCAQMAVNALKVYHPADNSNPYYGKSDDEIGQLLNINPALWTGQGLAGMLGETIANNVVNAYPAVYQLYNFLFVNPNNIEVFINNYNSGRFLGSTDSPGYSSQAGGANDSYEAWDYSSKPSSMAFAGWNLSALNPNSNGDGRIVLSNQATQLPLGYYTLFEISENGTSVPQELIGLSPVTPSNNSGAQWIVYPYLSSIGQQQLYFFTCEAQSGYLEGSSNEPEFTTGESIVADLNLQWNVIP